MTDDLTARVGRLESRIELDELITRYSLAVDDRDLDALAELFTSDASFDSVGGSPTGHDAIVAYYTARLERYGPTYHVPHGQVVEFVSDDEATGVVLAHAELSIGGEAFVVAMRYYDHYARQDGRWRFRSRRLESIYALPLAELPTRIGDDLRKRWPGSDPEPAELPEAVETYRDFVARRAARQE